MVLGKWLATDPGILLLMDPTRGIDVGTKQELYVLIRQLADLGTTVLFYSTDYDELIGMCDRVAIIYRGQVVRELTGADITENNIVAASLSIGVDASRRVAHDNARMNALLRATRRNQGAVFAAALFGVLFVAFLILHPRGLSIMVTTPAANQGLALAFAAMAQTLPVLTGGLDLSVGSVLALSNCVASHLVSGSTAQIVGGIAVTLLAGAACGFFNGVVVVAGRIQPIIATLATGAIFTGIAYLLRPIPGGSIDEDLGDLLTNETFGVIPTSLLLLAGVLLVVWVPFRNSVLGRGCYAAGSSEAAAFLSGVRVGRSRLAAYTLAGLLAACGGLFLALQTLSGDAQVGADYTLKSIAAVVIGGTSLLGGSGGVMGSIFGAYALRAISGLLLFAGVSPLAQPLFEGVVLMVAIGLGAIRILANRNRLELLSAQETARSDPSRPLIRGLDNSVLVALGAIVVVLLIGSYYLPAFLSPAYLVLQLRIAAFLGIVAAGADGGDPARPHRPVDPLDDDGHGHDGDDAGRDGRSVGWIGDPARPRGGYGDGAVQRRSESPICGCRR